MQHPKRALILLFTTATLTAQACATTTEESEGAAKQATQEAVRNPDELLYKLICQGPENDGDFDLEVKRNAGSYTVEGHATSDGVASMLNLSGAKLEKLATEIVKFYSNEAGIAAHHRLGNHQLNWVTLNKKTGTVSTDVEAGNLSLIYTNCNVRTWGF